MSYRKRTYSGYTKGSTMNEAKTQYQQRETIKDVEQYGFFSLPERGILEEDAVRFGVRSALSEQDGKTIVATYFPCHNKQKKIIGYQKRDWTKLKEEDGHFTAVGVVKPSGMLFNQANCRGGKTIYIVESPEEVIAARRCILESLKGSKWEGKLEPNIVSITNGCANAVEQIAQNEDFLRQYEEIVLCFNNDHATPKEAVKGIKKGREATEDVASYLMSNNIYIVEVVQGKNDIRQCLVEGAALEMGKALAFEKKKYSPEKIVSGDNVHIEELIEPLREGIVIDRFPRLMKKLHGFRTGELTMYCAFSGVGKSTIAREVAYEAILKGEKVGFIFLEEPRIKTQQALLCLDMGVKLPEFRKDPLKVATIEKIEESKNRILSNGRTYFLDHFGSMKPQKLVDQVRYLHLICGCTHIVLDHISMVISGIETNNERKDIDILLTELASFVSAYPDCAIHAISHLKRVDDTKPKLKDGEEPKPYWREVRKEMLRGSGAIEQLSFNIICVENEVLPSGERGRIRLRLEKNREWGELGLCDTLVMKDDGRMYVAEDEVSF